MPEREDKYKEEIEDILEDAGDLPEKPSVDWKSHPPLSEEIALWYRSQRSFKRSFLGFPKSLLSALFFLGLFVLTKFYLFLLVGICMLGLSIFMFLFRHKQ